MLRLGDALGKCLQIHEIYVKKHGYLPIKVPCLSSIISKLSSLKINLLCPQMDVDNSICGTVLVYEDYANVFINPNQNRCWTRYATVKELSHIAMDSSEAHVTDLVGLVDDLTMTWLFDSTEAAQAEKSAYVAGIELLLPYYKYKEIKALCTEKSPWDVAKTYLIPESMVKVWLNSRYKQMVLPEYRNLLGFHPRL